MSLFSPGRSVVSNLQINSSSATLCCDFPFNLLCQRAAPFWSVVEHPGRFKTLPHWFFFFEGQIYVSLSFRSETLKTSLLPELSTPFWKHHQYPNFSEIHSEIQPTSSEAEDVAPVCKRCYILLDLWLVFGTDNNRKPKLLSPGFTFSYVYVRDQNQQQLSGNFQVLLTSKCWTRCPRYQATGASGPVWW